MYHVSARAFRAALSQLRNSDPRLMRSPLVRRSRTLREGKWPLADGTRNRAELRDLEKPLGFAQRLLLAIEFRTSGIAAHNVLST